MYFLRERSNIDAHIENPSTYLLVHSPDSLNDWSWAGDETGSWGLNPGLPSGWKNPITVAITAACQDPH